MTGSSQSWMGKLEFMSEPVAAWQLQMIHDFIALVPITEVEFLLGYYGKETRLKFWTASYDRARELIERLDESVIK
jgi:hypothetical protein